MNRDEFSNGRVRREALAKPRRPRREAGEIGEVLGEPDGKFAFAVRQLQPRHVSSMTTAPFAMDVSCSKVTCCLEAIATQQFEGSQRVLTGNGFQRRRRRESRKHWKQMAIPAEFDRSPTMAIGEHLSHFLSDSFGADYRELAGHFANGGGGGIIEPKSERRREPNGSQQSQLVFLHPLARFADRANQTAVKSDCPPM